MSNLKIRINTGVNKAHSLTTTPGTPAATPGGSRPKLKFTTNSTPSTPAPCETSTPKKTKAGRASKPTPKVIEDRKRQREDSEAEDENPSSIHVELRKKVTIALKNKNTQPRPTLKVKIRNETPNRADNPGQGYDSEASDKEDDPVIEEQLVLRMQPGEDCDYLRKAIAEKRIGVPRSQGGADVQMKFFHAEGRRACITIRGKHYAATLVDLPCIIEGMKSWDKRGWWKSADICQMLLVFSPVHNEDDAKTIPLPQELDQQTYQWPHGLTPPMYYARQRRFRKRMHRSQIEAVESQVERLLAADAAALSTTYRIYDPEAEERRISQAESPASDGYGSSGEEYSADEDAEGEVDDSGYFNKNHNEGQNGQVYDAGMDLDNEAELDLEAELEAGLAAAELEESSQLEAATPMSAPASTPAAPIGETEEDSGDESGDDAEDAVVDEQAREAAEAERKRVQDLKDEIADLEDQSKHIQDQLAVTTNPLLRKRLEGSLRKTKIDIEMKMNDISGDTQQ